MDQVNQLNKQALAAMVEELARNLKPQHKQKRGMLY